MTEANNVEKEEDVATVVVRRMSGAPVGTFEVPNGQPVSFLKQVIAEGGGPAPSDQQLVLGHRVLCDLDTVREALGEGQGNMVFLVTVAGCPTCKGPCACEICGCRPQHGLIDYYGVCKECGKCGGHRSACPFCVQTYPSLCALDTHVKFVHPEQSHEWQTSRLEEHIRLRHEPGARRAAMPVPGKFVEACRGGLGPSWKN